MKYMVYILLIVVAMLAACSNEQVVQEPAQEQETQTQETTSQETTTTEEVPEVEEQEVEEVDEIISAVEADLDLLA